jgi:hypothetical protein
VFTLAQPLSTDHKATDRVSVISRLASYSTPPGFLTLASVCALDSPSRLRIGSGETSSKSARRRSTKALMSYVL